MMRRGAVHAFGVWLIVAAASPVWAGGESAPDAATLALPATPLPLLVSAAIVPATWVPCQLEAWAVWA